MNNVLPTEPIAAGKADKSRSYHVSALGVIFTMILAIVVILLGERIMFDLNRVANPLVEATALVEVRGDYPYAENNLASEKSSLSSTRIYYQRDKVEEYRLYRLLIHAAFVIPAFLMMFLFYYVMNLKKRNQNWQVAVWAYMVGAIWILLHLIGEAGRYVISAYRNAAIYIILIFLAAVLTSLAVMMQKKKIADN